MPPTNPAPESAPPLSDPPSRDDPKMLWSFIHLASGLGAFFVTTVLIFLGLGLLADHYLHTGATGLIIAITLGTVIGMWFLHRRVGQVLKKLYPPKNARR
jgi:F0F1-type ATP synthase assembly protein I